MKYLLLAWLALWPISAVAQDDLRLAVPTAVDDSGLLDYILPRFTLKHRLRVTPVAPDDAAQMVLGDSGTPVFSGLGQTFAISGDDSDAARILTAWLLSDVGQNTIAAYAPEGEQMFTPPVLEKAAPVEIRFEGDAALGETLSLEHCGRCHVINETNRMKGMGATPSFAVLRTLPGWQNRFATFYVLNPHPSFTQITDITPPFDPARPPPIVPVDIDQDALEAILAYVQEITPADLGAPLQFQ